MEWVLIGHSERREYFKDGRDTCFLSLQWKSPTVQPPHRGSSMLDFTHVAEVLKGKVFVLITSKASA